MSAGKNAKVGACELLGQQGAKLFDEIGRGRMALLQGYQYVGIFGPNCASIVVGHVDPAIGEPDVVDDVVDLFCRDNFADGVLDEITKTGRLLNTGACRGADVHKNLTGIDGWEKVLAEERCQSKGQEHAG